MLGVCKCKKTYDEGFTMTDVVEAFKYGQLTSMMIPGHILVDFIRESRERGANFD